MRKRVDEKTDDEIIAEAGLMHFFRSKETEDSITNSKFNMLKKIFQWFVYSSSNPSAISLTLKGLVPLLLVFGVDATDSEMLTDNISQAILGIGYVITATMTVAGLLRKIANSLNL